MSDWTRQAAEQICREIFASVAYPDEALIERVGKAIEDQSLDYVDFWKKQHYSLSETYALLATQRESWRKRAEEAEAQISVLINLSEDIKSVAMKNPDPYNRGKHDARVDLQTALKPDAGRPLLERLRQAEASADKWKNLANSESARANELTARREKCNRLREELREARAAAATARRAALEQAGNLASGTTAYSKIRALLEKEEQ